MLNKAHKIDLLGLLRYNKILIVITSCMKKEGINYGCTKFAEKVRKVRSLSV